MIFAARSASGRADGVFGVLLFVLIGADFMGDSVVVLGDTFVGVISDADFFKGTLTLSMFSFDGFTNLFDMLMGMYLASAIRSM